MIILEKPSSAKFVPNTQLYIAAVFGIGIFACLILCVAAFALLVYIMTLALQATDELVSSLSHLYTQGDSLLKLLMWLCALFILVKLYPLVVRSVRASLTVRTTK